MRNLYEINKLEDSDRGTMVHFTDSYGDDRKVPVDVLLEMDAVTEACDWYEVSTGGKEIVIVAGRDDEEYDEFHQPISILLTELMDDYLKDEQ